MLLPERWRKRTAVKAVHDDHIEGLLRRLGVFDDVIEGRRQCDICHGPLSISAIGCLFSRRGELRIACTRDACCAAALAGREAE